MAVEPVLVSVFLAALAGLGLSLAIERLLTPRPRLIRPWAAGALHAGLWLSADGLLTLLLGRPWFAAAALSAFLLTLVLVNNAKVNALGEPFVFQDYEYFTDAIRHPRLYVPFMGWWKFLGAAGGLVLAVTVGLLGEAVPAERFVCSGQAGGALVVFAIGVLLLRAGSGKSLAVSFKAEHDMRTLGLLASLWRYGEEERAPVTFSSPFDLPPAKYAGNGLPHLVAVQSESFFDPRSLYSGIHSGLLTAFDRLKRDAVAYGKLQVPAWGANTVRTEFAFLSGIGEDQLGVHRFNPYRVVAAGRDVATLALYLKRLGYRTVCIHPYPASFYQRDRVYPRLGFDEFLDIRAFRNAQRFGPYISDAAVADQVATLLGKSASPLFIFVITMENHGPLHLERVEPSPVDEFYTRPPPVGCDDLTIYLRHLRNADRMIAALRRTLEECRQPASLCWFGDHVPIMPAVYETFGRPNGKVDYVFWSNQSRQPSRCDDRQAQDLSMSWLRTLGLAENSDLSERVA